jgi:hypothetical protein
VGLTIEEQICEIAYELDSIRELEDVIDLCVCKISDILHMQDSKVKVVTYAY